MSRRPLLLTASAAAALLALHAYVSRPLHAPAAPSAGPRESATEAAPARAAAPVAATPARRGVWARYRLSSTERAAINGREQAKVITEGTWTTVERAGGRIEARFAASRVEMVGEQAPSIDELAAPFELVQEDGVLRAIAFSKGTSRAARAWLTGLATTFQRTAGEGASWTAEEEDLAGHYLASYQRRGDRVTRARSRYTALRTAAGLTTDGASDFVPSESSEMRFDDRGLVSATVRIDGRFTAGIGAIELSMSHSATLVREATEERLLVAGRGYDAAPISNHIDQAALAKAGAKALVAGKTTPELLAEAFEAARLAPTEANRGARTSGALHRLAALTQIDPEAASAIAAAIRRDPRDSATVGLLLGALSSSVEPSATNAMASLLQADDLPADVRAQVLRQLNVAQTPTPEGAEALTKELDGSSGDVAALALGAQARGLTGETAPPSFDSSGEEAIDKLLELYAAAATKEAKRLALLALGNTGSSRVLDVMKANIQGGDLDLARIATFGLRFIRDDEADALLFALIQGDSLLVLTALQAISFRSPEVWRPRLVAAMETYASQDQVRATIKMVLSRWAAAAK